MIQDLSSFHEPISDFFTEPSAPMDCALTDEQVRFYRENGYLLGVTMLDDNQVDALVAEVQLLSDPSHEGHHLFYEFHSNESGDLQNVLFHALGAWRISPVFHDLLWCSRFTTPARQLLDGNVRFWHDQLFCKPSHHGGVVAWHQDYSYWTRTKPMAHLSCFIALDDTTRENGCLQYVPGSHRWELLPITGLAGDMSAIESVLSEELRQFFKPVPVELKRGQASFHHPLMVHGSLENRSGSPRRATVINVFRDGVMSASDQPLLEGVPAIPSGEKMQGRFFPLLNKLIE